MKILFYISLILPAIYIGTILVGFIGGILFKFDLADSIRPYNDEVAASIAILTFTYVGICWFILANRSLDKKTKIWWAVILFLLNMLAVPWFLYHCDKNTLENIFDKNRR
jgi:hypothetical protein